MVFKQLKLPKFTMPRLEFRAYGGFFKKLTWLGLLAGAMAGAFYMGRHGGSSEVRGQTPQNPLDTAAVQKAMYADRGRHVIAYIYNSIPITREELGEYLVERVGAERLDFLINRKIIEQTCAAVNIHITDTEINAQFVEDCRSMGCTEAQFVTNILRPRNKTVFEWKEDVIRPKLALERYIKDRIVITEEDIRNGFEAKYGPKVECRIIVLTKEETKKKDEIWARAKVDFERCATEQSVAQFASVAGKIDPIHKHFADPNIEQAAFKLKPGEISPLIYMNDGTMVILQCKGLIEADPAKKLNEERLALNRELFQVRVAKAVPEEFMKMRKAADPKIFLQREVAPMDMSQFMTQQQVQQAQQAPPAPTAAQSQLPPQGPPATPPTVNVPDTNVPVPPK